MIKRIFSIIICICLLLTFAVSCKKTPQDVLLPDTTINDSFSNEHTFTIPHNLITTEEYHNEINKLLATQNLSVADTDAIDKLGDRLYESIHYNMDDIKTATGTIYYVAVNGNDDNDGKTPQTAWATLEKVNNFELNPGDAVLFKRGEEWFGDIKAKNGVSYGAYGSGPKPIINFSINGKTYAEWVKTDTENVWKLNKKIIPTVAKDVGTLLFDGRTSYATLTEVDKLNSNVKFAFSGVYSKSAKKNNYVYLYCDKGNPAEVYDTIEITLSGSIIKMDEGAHDITLNNLNLFGGDNAFFATSLSNIKMTYCETYWQGGSRDGSLRLGGGAGAWFSCDGIYIENCHIYQQFDSGVTPQFAQSTMTSPSIFKNFVTKNCLFEYCEYTLEYFNTQRDFDNNGFENMYFGYNFCRYGGQGFGDKPKASRYVRSGGHENLCTNCKIEYNIFDRATTYCIEVVSLGQLKVGQKKYEYLPFSQMPKFNNNIYIHNKNERFAIINDKTYDFNGATYNLLKENGFETGAVYLYAK